MSRKVRAVGFSKKSSRKRNEPKRLLRRAIRVALGSIMSLTTYTAHADLPVACVAGACGVNGGANAWVTSGSASLVSQGASLTIQQNSSRAVLNWQSFNIGAGNSVEFKQPNAAAVALNRIFQTDPSRIFGKLTANGQVYLINQNGIVFGAGAQVNVSGLVASSLDIAPEAIEKGLVRTLTEDRKAAFTAFRDDQGNLISGDVRVEEGATLTSADGGQILLFAPNVSNGGTISTPNGQSVLAAGTSVYLAVDSTDTNLRGLIVEVDVEGVSDEDLQKFLAGELAELPLGKAQNFGTISTATGNISMVGLAVNQMGRVSATTSVLANGSVHLRAADKVDPNSIAGGTLSTPTRGGRLVLGEGSVTEVLLDDDDSAKTVDVNEQPKSRVELTGHTVQLLQDSTVTATGGAVSIRAQANPGQSDSTVSASDANGSRVLLESGARIDVSGAVVELAADAHTIEVELFSEQLKDSPLQRDGILKGKTVTVDLRRSGTREDGSEWIGTPLADVSGSVAAVERSVAERNVEGGTIDIASQGDVIVDSAAVMDISGGRIDYAEGKVQTTKLVSQGKIYDISEADPDRIYDGIVGEYMKRDQKWGVTETWQVPAAVSSYSPAVSEGYDAGTLTVNASRAILDGSVKGSVTQGFYQRDPADIPTAGTLVLGYETGATENPASYHTGPVVVAESLILNALEATGFDPHFDELPEDFPQTVVRPSLFGGDGIAHAVLLSNESITVSEQSTVELPAGGSLELRGSTIDIFGSIVAPAGSIHAVAERTVAHPEILGHDVVVHSGAVLDARGQWVNDYLVAGNSVPVPLWIDGGSVSLTSSSGNVVLESGAGIDVSGSAWVQVDGTVHAGQGGSIALAATDAGTNSAVRLEGTLTASGLQDGGSLSITTDAVCISSVGCGQTIDETVFEVLTLSPDFFREGGFSSYSLVSKRGDLVVAGDANVNLRQLNRVLDSTYLDQASGARLEDFSHMAELPDHLRNPTSLSLATTAYHPAELRVETGATITADAGAKIGLATRSRMWVDGTLHTAGGSVTLSLLPHSAALNFVPNEVIWLGTNANVDVSGTTLLTPNTLGIRQGEVVGGGEVVLRADRGYVVAESGSRLDVSGAAAELDITNAGGLPESRVVASDAGTISVSAAEGVVLEGELVGRAGGDNALGGTLSLVLDGNTRNEPSSERLENSSNLYPHGSRIIRIVEEKPSGDLGDTTYETLDQDFTVEQNGVAKVSSEAVESGGFDSLELTVRHLLTNQADASEADLVRSTGIVQVAADMNVGRRLVIDTPLIEVTAPNVTLSAAYVALGSTDQDSQYVPTPELGIRSLLVQGQWIDLIGASVVSGALDVRLQSEGDLRLRAIPQLDPTTRELTGSFTTFGDLELQASQIYPTTLTEFTLTALDTGSTITVLPGDGEQGPVLSAGGTIRLQASNIEQHGVIKAPLGSIELNAAETDGAHGRLVLAPGSVTSTSANGLIVPVGRTEGGLDWVYDLGNDQNLVLSEELDPIPQQNISLSGRDVQLQEGAVLNVSGGGDMQAYEFVAGVGGSHDILALDEVPNSYAIVPNLGATVGAYDHQESADFSTPIGTTVHLDAVGDLPAGEYVLLPARYALLPGAYLVTEVSGYGDIPTGTQYTLRDGTPVVAGTYGVAGTDQVESRTHGFSVVSGDLLRDATNEHRPAEYALSLASDFFAAQAIEDNTGQRLPLDAGTVSIRANESLDLLATLDGEAADDGRGAAVDIAAGQILIVADDADITDEDVLPIEAEALNRLGAESIVLGAVREQTADGVSLDVISSDVTVAEGARIEAPEILLVASQNLNVESEAHIAGTGSAAAAGAAYVISGDSALLRVSAGPQADIIRANSSGASGSMQIASGATIAATGAVFIDATADIGFEGDLQLDGGDLAIAASTINIGAVPDSVTGFNLDEAQLNDLGQTVETLLLRSRSDINLYDAPQLVAGELILDAGSVVARSGTDDSVTAITADKVVFANTAASTATPADATYGRLEVVADEIEIAEGSSAIAGFERVSLAARNRLFGRDAGDLKVEGSSAVPAADLQLSAGVIGGWAGARTGIEATGGVDILWNGVSPPPSDDTLGATLTIGGDSVRHSGRIMAEAGKVELSASGSGGVTVASAAVIDVSGASRQFDSKQVFAAAGDVVLRAQAGDVAVETGAVIDVSGATGSGGNGGDAGSVRIEAAQGTIRLDGDLSATAVAAQRQGSIELDGRHVDELNALNTRLNAAGFTDERVLRVREGNLTLTSQIVADKIEITADGANGSGGDLTIGALLDARAESGGKVRLSALGDITLTAAARVDAAATTAGEEGGSIELLSQGGGIRLLGGSRLSTAGGAASGTGTAAGAGGSVHMRVSRDVLAELLSSPGNDAMVLDGVIAGAGEIVLEGVKHYQDADGTISFDQVQAYSAEAFIDADAFMQTAADIRTVLGRDADASFHVRPGVEISSEGDLSLDASWDLSSWRFDGEPGYLTLRAAGDININQDLSDGFSSSYYYFMDQPVEASWSYRLTAGADLDSASASATRDRAETGSLIVGPGSFGTQRVIRTGSGDIEISAARDVRLTDSTSVIYTAGVPVTDMSTAVVNFMSDYGLRDIALTEGGGDISIDAGGDVAGMPSDQLVTDWLWRIASDRSRSDAAPTLWGVNFSRFRQGVGALGGGDVTIRARGDVDNMSAVISSTGVPVGATQSDNVVEVRGGGDLSIEAGGDIGGGVYYVGLGAGELRAGGDIRAGTDWNYAGTPLHTTLALGDGQFSLTARGDLAIETVFNPTLLSPSWMQGSIAGEELLADFSTYSANSAVQLTAIAGDALLNANISALSNYASSSLGSGLRNPVDILAILPPSLKMRSLSGDVSSGQADGRIGNSLLRMMPAPQGTLELLAFGDVDFVETGYLISDADPALLPTPLRPELPSSPGTVPTSLLSLLSTFGQFVHAPVPVHSAEYAENEGYLGEPSLTLIVAKTGDIDMSAWSTSSSAMLLSSMPVKLIAGRDIIDPSMVIQNVSEANVSSLSAGRDITYLVSRDANRRILQKDSQRDGAIVVDGPGELLVSAGRNIDLKASAGIVTRGNTVNPVLAEDGASITALAGLGDGQPDYDAFIEKYLADSTVHRDLLKSYMRARSDAASPEDILEAFMLLPREQQMPLLARVMFAELRASGRAAAAGETDYSAGYEAIETLFSDIDPEEAQTGDLNLFFSRIYTLDGGGINAVVPGGVVNVGLAAAPDSFGIVKPPSKLGIVAQRAGDVNILSGVDTLVNQSRVFAADGGSILIWSSAGNIDAGRGAKTAISAPPPIITYSPDGTAEVQFGQALAGSGIRAFVTTEGREPGDVDLFAPTGVIFVNDAGIGTAGNLTIGATQVIGAENIDVGGVAVGVPVDAGGLGASLAGVSSASSSASNAATSTDADGGAEQEQAPLADTALSWLEVFVVGLGEETCRQDDIECLKRQQSEE